MAHINVPYELFNFNNRPSVKSKGVQRVTWQDLIFSAATVGVNPGLTGLGRPILELEWRICMVLANLKEFSHNSASYLRKSVAYRRLDPSEKSAVSFFIGMTMASVMSRKLLGYPWLVHLDSVLQQNSISLTGSRPDFIGMTATNNSGTMDVCAVEAKGRTGKFSRATLDAAKVQSKKIPKIANHNFIESIASLAYYDSKHDYLCVALEDPENDSQDQKEVDLSDLLKAYYKPLIEAALEVGFEKESSEFYSFQLEELGIKFKISSSVWEAYIRERDVPENLETAEGDEESRGANEEISTVIMKSASLESDPSLYETCLANAASGREDVVVEILKVRPKKILEGKIVYDNLEMIYKDWYEH